MSAPTHQKHDAALPAPPEAWDQARKLAQLAMAPVERFLAIQASSGILLFIAAIIALLWANSPWREFYTALWHIPIAFQFGDWSFSRELHFWINDGLMTIFFFVVGLEIRREIHRGELSEWRRAALPLAAALGGMLVPALIFLSLNAGRATASGWGVPMATDIAFAVGVLALLGNRVPRALRILLLALAVIDDVGAIIVIALFYSSQLAPMGFVIAGAGIALIFTMQKVGIRSPWAYVVPGLVTWGGVYAAGIHPTLAGVAIGLLTPVKAWYGPTLFVQQTRRRLERLARHSPHSDEQDMIEDLNAIEEARREAVSPVERLQHALHGWVAFLIMPLFALANSGVTLGSAELEADGMRVFWGILFGLFAGKLLGVMGAAYLVTKTGLTTLPSGLGWKHIVVVGFCAGIGFTMAIFIANLAFPIGPMLETAKLAILCTSAIAAITATLVGWRALSPTNAHT